MKVVAIALAMVFGASSLVQAQCSNPEGFNAMSAALGVAVAKETGRLNAMVDLKIAGDRLALTTTGLAKCTALGSCRNIQGILDMQKDEVSQYIDPAIFNPSIFRSRLVVQYQRQQVAAARPTHDPNRSWAPDHKLDLLNTSYVGVCGTHYWFKVTGLTSTRPTPGHMCSQLIFVGSQGTFNNGVCVSDNPYLDFRYNNSLTYFDFGIDPLTSIANVTDYVVAANQVIESCYYVDGSQTAGGHPCNCNSKSGVLVQTNVNSALFTCSTAK